MTCSRTVSTNCPNQSTQRKVEGPLTTNTVGTIVVGHPLDKCITFKEHVMRLARDERIIPDLDETSEASHITVQEVDE